MVDSLSSTLTEMDSRASRALLLGAVLLCIGAVALVVSCTRWGVGIGGDGVAYIAAARNLLDGNGLSWIGPEGDIRPLVIFAPLFPFLLSLLGLAGFDPVEGARWLEVALFGINVLMVVVVLFWASRQVWVALLGGVLAVFSPELLSLHANAVSEPVFFIFLLLSLLLLTAYLEGGSLKWLVPSAAAMGLAYLSRYAGLFFIPVALATVLVFGQAGWKTRVRNAAIYAAATGLAVGGWMLRNQLLLGSATSRTFAPAPLSTQVARVILDTVTYWFLPGRLPLGFRVVAVLALSLVLVGAWIRTWGRDVAQMLLRRLTPSRQVLLPLILTSAILVYLGCLLVVRCLFIPRISIDGRTLAPVHLLIVLLGLCMASGVGQGNRLSRKVRGLLVAGAFLFGLSYISRGAIRALELQADGQGYSSRAWRTSPLINALRLLPLDTAIYTNEVEALYLLADRHAYRLPTGCLPYDALFTDSPETRCNTGEYLAWSRQMRDRVEHDKAVLGIFNTYSEQPYYASLISELVEGLSVLSAQGDGRMYVYDLSQWPENPNW